jgi:hypothetical protein
MDATEREEARRSRWYLVPLHPRLVLCPRVEAGPHDAVEAARGKKGLLGLPRAGVLVAQHPARHLPVQLRQAVLNCSTQGGTASTRGPAAAAGRSQPQRWLIAQLWLRLLRHEIEKTAVPGYIWTSSSRAVALESPQPAQV